MVLSVEVSGSRRDLRRCRWLVPCIAFEWLGSSGFGGGRFGGSGFGGGGSMGFGGGFGGGMFGKQLGKRTDEEIERDIAIKVPPDQLCHTPETIPKLNKPQSFVDDNFFWDMNPMELPARLTLQAKAIQARNKDAENAHEDILLTLDEAIAVRRSLLQMVHPLNEPRRKRGLALMQTTAAAFVHLIFRACDQIEFAIEETQTKAALNEWRVMQAVFHRLIGMRLNDEWKDKMDMRKFHDYVVSSPPLKTALGRVTNCLYQSQTSTVPFLQPGSYKADLITENAAKWFSKFSLPETPSRNLLDRLKDMSKYLDEHFMDYQSTRDERHYRRSRKDLTRFVQLYDLRYIDRERMRHLRRFLKGKIASLEPRSSQVISSSGSPNAKIVAPQEPGYGEKGEVILPEFADRFADSKIEQSGTEEAFGEWLVFHEDSGTTTWVHRLLDPSLAITGLFKLEQGVMFAASALSAMLQILTQPEDYYSLFESACAGDLHKWERPSCCWRFFCDQTLAEFGRLLRTNSELIPWLDRLPSAFKFDASKLRKVIFDPSWGARQEYLWKQEIEQSKLAMHQLTSKQDWIHNRLRVHEKIRLANEDLRVSQRSHETVSMTPSPNISGATAKPRSS
eukprot:Gregarina_sp_Poly_1__2492@NODE_1676_length_3552_cov_95_143185_g1102_i0_p1_GENE_NODE_1676_length_3552_cov_95_143185_g1102_i0NODE_1676_length_3552_cov_95_143185_g1102_i0_p1_ORF_typecomplete_len620_score103_08Keratin_2_head/PF16208_5/0_63_NODE_1676_length_3552_cov_95_143185_g1102_i011372996